MVVLLPRSSNSICNTGLVLQFDLSDALGVDSSNATKQKNIESKSSGRFNFKFVIFWSSSEDLDSVSLRRIADKFSFRYDGFNVVVAKKCFPVELLIFFEDSV